MNMISQIINLFVCVELPVELREKIAALAKELPADSIKPIRPEDMHLTLKNIGAYTPETFKEIEQDLQTIEFSPFTVSLKGVMVLPNEDIPRIISVGIDCEKNDLAEKVEEALAGIVKKESPGFPRHLIIADVWKRTDLSKFLKKHKDEEFGSFKVNKFYLMQSYFDLDERSESRDRDLTNVIRSRRCPERIAVQTHQRSRDLRNPRTYMVLREFGSS